MSEAYEQGARNQSTARRSDSRAADLHDSWVQDWRFLTGSGELHSTEFDATFRGLALPRAVVDKVYRGNARKMFPRAWE